MMRLIDADALWEQISQHSPFDALSLIEDAPTITAIPIRNGHWIEEPIEDEWGKLPSIWHCSECDNLEFNNSPYCPYCGAKMSEVGDETD